MQWRPKVVDSPGEAKSTGQILTELISRIKRIYAQKGEQNRKAIVNLAWNFSSRKLDGMKQNFDPHRVAKEINGYFLKDTEIGGKLFRQGTQVPHQKYLRSDGSTACGNWLYCSSYTEEGNQSARRIKDDPTGIGLYPKWAWSWPNNCRILHNRVSIDNKGRPWKKEKAVLWRGDYQWEGDVPDGDQPPNKGSRYAFTMLPEGLARVFGPGLADGPFPEHYEPLECPIERNLLSSQRLNPTIKLLSTKGIREGEDRFMTCDPKFPIVCTTYRVSEHWQTGVFTRRQPWLMELQPCLFIEMCLELAENKGIKNGNLCLIKSARGNLEAVDVVTDRLQPLI